MVNLTGTKRGKVLIIGFDKVINEMNFWKCHCQKCQNIFSKSEAHFRKERFLQNCPFCDKEAFYIHKEEKLKEIDLTGITFKPVAEEGKRIHETTAIPLTDYSNKQINQIYVFNYTNKTIGRARIWNCYCSVCKEYVEVPTKRLFGDCSSCGCLGKGQKQKPRTELKLNGSINPKTKESHQIDRYVEKEIGSLYCGFKLLVPTNERIKRQILWVVLAPDGQKLKRTKLQMKKEAYLYDKKGCEATCLSKPF